MHVLHETQTNKVHSSNQNVFGGRVLNAMSVRLVASSGRVFEHIARRCIKPFGGQKRGSSEPPQIPKKTHPEVKILRLKFI